MSEAVNRTPAASSETVRNNMKRQRRRDTGCEMAVRRHLHASGLRYRVDFRPLREQRFRADIGWKGRKIAIFIDGCFWHGCQSHGALPKSNTEWWAEKLESNRARDRRVDRLLTEAGWTVLRFWEHEDAANVASVIIETISRRYPRSNA